MHNSTCKVILSILCAIYVIGDSGAVRAQNTQLLHQPGKGTLRMYEPPPPPVGYGTPLASWRMMESNVAAVVDASSYTNTGNIYYSGYYYPAWFTNKPEVCSTPGSLKVRDDSFGGTVSLSNYLAQTAFTNLVAQGYPQLSFGTWMYGFSESASPGYYWGYYNLYVDNTGFLLAYNNPTNARYLIGSGAQYIDVVRTNSAKSWHYYSGSYDGTNTRCYYDGILISTIAKSLAKLDQPKPFKIGQGNSHAYYRDSYAWNSVISSQAFYNIATADTYPTNAPILAWKFTNDTIRVPSEIGNIAGLMRDPVSSYSPIFTDGAYKFDGVDDRLWAEPVTMGYWGYTNYSYNITNDFTITAWVNCETHMLRQTHRLVALHSTTSGGHWNGTNILAFIIGCNGIGKDGALYLGSDNFNSAYTATNVVPTNAWTFLAVAYSKTNATATRFWMNGTNVPSIWNTNIVFDVENCGWVYLGHAVSGSSSANLKGMLKKVRIWGKFLTDANVLAEYSE